MTKACSRCGEDKPLAAFYADKSHRLGVSSVCKACQIARSSERYWADLDAAKAYQRDYYQWLRMQGFPKDGRE